MVCLLFYDQTIGYWPAHKIFLENLHVLMFCFNAESIKWTVSYNVKYVSTQLVYVYILYRHQAQQQPLQVVWSFNIQCCGILKKNYIFIIDATMTMSAGGHFCLARF